MVNSVGVPIVDYTLAIKNQARLLAQFQKTPDYAKSVAYYRANIGKVNSVDALLNDRKLLTTALSAFQLESQVDAKGIIRKLLSEDPTAKTSLAQKLLDPRYLQFAKAFASLRSDAGAGVQDSNSVNTVLAGYQTNEYSKWVSTNDNDPTVRQALFFQQTVQDTVDISDTGKLFGQFQQASDVQQAVAAYKSGVAKVTSVNDLLNNPQVLDVALSAFNIDPKTVTRDTLRRLLNEPTTSPLSNPSAPSLATDPLAAADLRLAQFAITFNSLSTDGGATLRSSKSVDDVIARYQRNQFGKTVAANDPTTIAADFGAKGASTINTLLGDLQAKSGVSQAVSYYQNKIGTVSSVDGLVGDKQLLSVALGAFNIDPAKVPADVVRQLLANDPKASPDVQAKATFLLQNDPDVAAFVKTFGSLSAHGGGGFSSVGNLFGQFQQLGSVQSAASDFESRIGTVTNVADLTGDVKLLNFALTAFGLDPAAVSAGTVTQLLSKSPAAQAADPLVTSDARFAQFVQAFGSLNTDGGAALKVPNEINAIVSAYRTNLFAQTVATNDPATTGATFADGSSTIDKLSADFAASSGVAQSTGYYQSRIGGVTTVAGLTGDAKLLKVALGAFNLDPGQLSTSALNDLLSGNPSAPALALTQQDPDVAKFVAAFGSLNSDNGVQVGAFANIAATTSAFQANSFKQSIAARTAAVIANPSLATATAPLAQSSSVTAIVSAFQGNQLKQSIASTVQSLASSPSAGTLSTIQLLGNATLSAVTYGALNLPTSVGALPVAQQVAALSNAHFDASKLLDHNFLNKFIDQFLANAGAQQASSDPLASLIQPVGDGTNVPDLSIPPTGVDLGFLTGRSGTASILNLFV